MGRNILHVIEAREQQGTEGPLAHDQAVVVRLVSQIMDAIDGASCGYRCRRPTRDH
jgi:hypothetical protein